jgi:four helix bundle protein
MKIDKFEDILAWKRSRQLTILVKQNFKNCRDFSFKDQIQRATVSIMNNIAEGFERQSNKEFKHFLFVAKGSAGEVRSMLYVALDEADITQAQFEEMYALSLETAKLLSGLIKSISV